MSKRPVTAPEVARMREMAEDGALLTHIARKFGRSQSTVRKYAGDLIPLGQRRPEGVERMREMARAGRSVAFIAIEVGCSEWVALKHTRDIRVPRRRARLERLLRDYDNAERGTLHIVAARFGYASTASLHAWVHQVRKRMRSEMKDVA